MNNQTDVQNKPTWREAMDSFIRYLESGGSRTGSPISKTYREQLIFKISGFYSTPEEKIAERAKKRHCNQNKEPVAFGAVWLDAKNNREILSEIVKDRKPCDANKWIRYLKQFWAFCGMYDDDGDGLDLDEYKVNPANGKRFRFRKEKSKHGLVTDPENRKVLEYLRKQQSEKPSFINLRNLCMFGLLYHSGCRPCELVSIDREQINKIALKQGLVIIDDIKTKDYNDDRSILLPPSGTEERAELEKYLKFYDSMFPDNESKKLFLSEAGKPLRSGVLQNHIKPLRKKLKLRDDYSVYALRHNKATLLIKASVNPIAAQKIMGHKSLDTTTRYVHLHSQDIVAINNQMLSGTTKKETRSPREIFKDLQNQEQTQV